MALDYDESLQSEPHAPREWPAWLLSVSLHATLLMACGLFAPRSVQPAGEPHRTVGIALVRRSESNSDGGRNGHSAAAPRNSGRATEASTATADRAFLDKLPVLDELARDAAAAALPRTEGATRGAGAELDELGLPNAAGFATGLSQPGAGKGSLSGQTTTQVFGAQGTGTRFVYVFDRSASMGGFEGRPLRAAKAELVKSLRQLSAVHQFQIVFYNERPRVFNPPGTGRPAVMFATDENRDLAGQFIDDITPVGGTQHREALTLALGMGPDVIFFLTDADEPQLTPGELAELQRRNRAATVIHCIEFGAGEFSGDENFLVRLARQHRGQHVYVNVVSLAP
jgi:hypothetical protein